MPDAPSTDWHRTDWVALYREHVADLAALADGLDEAELATTVPGSPQWTVRDVYAHLAGVTSDSVSGRTDGAPGREWTARHVAERAGRPVAELVAELQGLLDPLTADWVPARPQGTVFDIAVHHADLHEALGRHRPDEHLWQPVLDAVADGIPAELLDASRAPGGRVSAYELFRGVFSRRSRSQMRAWGVDLPDGLLEETCIFGPRDDDQPVPA